MARKRSKAEVQADVTMHRTQVFTDAIVKIVSLVIQWGALVLIFWISAPALKVAVVALAGKKTVANFTFEWLMSKHATPVLSFVISVGSIVYGVKQSRLRRDTIKRFHKYQLKYETEIDPGRSSSELAPTGDTRKEDV